MIEEIEKYIKDNNLIDAGDTVFVALSGGADSTCLLHCLLALKEQFKITVNAIHINHMIREDAAKKDSEHCKELCKRLGVDLTIKDIDVRKFKAEHKLTLEQAGRAVRYREFEKLDGKIALGHNRNDQIETILMNILRGSSGDGLKGIRGKSGKYIRPLLDTRREEIEEYCRENNLDYVTDSSNFSNEFLRNAIRNKAIPLLNEITHKDIGESILRLSGIITEDSDFLETVSEEAFIKTVVITEARAVIDNERLILLDKAIGKRVIRKAIQAVKKNLTDIEYSHTSDVYELCRENLTGKKINLPDGVSALVQFNKTFIHKEETGDTFDLTLKIPGDTEIQGKNILIRTSLTDHFMKVNTKRSTQYFNYDKIKDDIHIRTKKEGDVVNPYKGNGTKKLKKYFIDKKIDRFKRNDLLLLAEGNTILYIFGLEFGKEYVPEQDCRVLKVEFLER